MGYSRRDLINDRTLSGGPVYVDVTHPHYDLRAQLLPALATVQSLALGDDEGTELFPAVHYCASVLRSQLSNPVHYGDNSAGLTDALSRPIPSASEFTYDDLVAFGITGPDGVEGFLRECGLPSQTPLLVIVLASVLLLVDDAVAKSEAGTVPRAIHLTGRALDAARYAEQLFRAPELELAKKFKGRGRGAGPMRKLVDSVLAKSGPKATARELWDACAAAPYARRLKIEFGDDDAFISGHGNVSFARFRNIVTDARKARGAR